MNLTNKEKETITSLIEKGVVRSTDRLGKMSHTQWGIMSSSVKEMPVVRMLSWFQRTEDEHISVVMRSTSEVRLEFLILFNKKSAVAVAEAVTKPYASKMKGLKNLACLTVGEVANVVAQSVLGFLADKYEAMIILSTPKVEEGPKAQLLANALENYDGRTDILLLSHVDMYSENLAAECNMVMIIDSEGLRALLRKTN